MKLFRAVMVPAAVLATAVLGCSSDRAEMQMQDPAPVQTAAPAPQTERTQQAANVRTGVGEEEQIVSPYSGEIYADMAASGPAAE